MKLVGLLEYLKLSKYISYDLTLAAMRCLSRWKIDLNTGSNALKGEHYWGFSCLMSMLCMFHSSEDLAGFVHTFIDEVRSNFRY